jgi:hypothetical protein
MQGKTMIRAIESIFEGARTGPVLRINTDVADLVTSGARDGAGGRTGDPKTAYLRLDCGQAEPFVKRWDAASGRAVCTRLMLLFVGVCLAALLVGTASRSRPLDATAQMERLAERLARAPSLPAPTQSEIARLLEQPWYDCSRVACSAGLEARNRHVRDQLRRLMAKREIKDQIGSSEMPTTSKRASAIPPLR